MGTVVVMTVIGALGAVTVVSVVVSSIFSAVAVLSVVVVVSSILSPVTVVSIVLKLDYHRIVIPRFWFDHYGWQLWYKGHLR
jgi:hypothetical protein